MLILGVFVNPAGGLSGVIQGAQQRLGRPGDILYYRRSHPDQLTSHPWRGIMTSIVPSPAIRGRALSGAETR
jgi:hypothetical protein